MDDGQWMMVHERWSMDDGPWIETFANYTDCELATTLQLQESLPILIAT